MNYSHQELINKYNIRTTFLDTLTLHKCIPADWLENLRHSSINTLDVHTNLIVINNKILDLTKWKCKDFYWHIINSNIRILSTICQWQKVVTPLKKTDTSFWKSIFRMPFITVRDPRIQTFQYRVIHRIVPCNEWLFKLTVKPSITCEYYFHSDSLIHLFINCEKTKAFWDCTIYSSCIYHVYSLDS